MKLNSDRLSEHLQKGLAPVYLIAGDETLLVTEAADAVRAAARSQGYEDREVFVADRSFDWSALRMAQASLSLFASRRLLELRLPTGKPGSGAAALVAYAQKPAEDTILLILSGKLDRAAQQSAWVKAVEKAGVLLTVWPVDRGRLPAWITRRMRSRGLLPSPAAVSLLAERVEGNLLAANQEIEKLAMLYGEASIDEQQVRTAVADSARFDVFGLVDTALAGQGARAVRMLQGLNQEGEALLLVLWALAREIRAVARYRAAVEAGERTDRVLAKVWNKRRTVIERAVKRYSAQHWRNLLMQAGRIDRLAKGIDRDVPAWDELMRLTAAVAGTDIRAGCNGAAGA